MLSGAAFVVAGGDEEPGAAEDRIGRIYAVAGGPGVLPEHGAVGGINAFVGTA